MPFSARAPDLDLASQELIDLLDEHQKIAFKRFGPDVAFDLGMAIKQTFESTYAGKPAGAIIAIRTLTDHTLFSCVVGDPSKTGPDNWAWADGKAEVVKKHGKSSLLMGRVLAKGGKDPADAGMSFPRFRLHGGAVPVWLENNTAGPVGVILVSGLPQLADHQLIIDTLENFLPTL